MHQQRIVIIGGGVIGLSTAYHLARSGQRHITLLEKDGIGDGSSSRAAGITSGLMWSETGVEARKLSIDQFQELSRILPDYHFHNTEGCLNLFDPSLWPDREKLLPLYDRLGVNYNVFDASTIHRRWPQIDPAGDILGLWDPRGGYSEPDEYVPALARSARELGVEIREHTRVLGFTHGGPRVNGVETAGGHFPADAVVLTVHAWTQPVIEPLGLSLPVKNFVHQRYLSSSLPEPCVIPPVNADIHGGYIRPAAGNRILLGVETSERDEWPVTSTDFHMSELTTPSELRDETAAVFTSTFPIVEDLSWESEQVGLISFSMDGEPLLGPVDSAPGLFVGLGFHSGGFSYNPAAGYLLAQYIIDGKTSLDLTAFSPNRFDQNETAHHLATLTPQKSAIRRRH